MIRYFQHELVAQKREKYVLAIILALIGLLSLFDVYEDWYDGAPIGHIIPEVILMAVSAGGVAFLVTHLYSSRKKIVEESQQEIARVKEAAQAWKARADSLSNGISDAIGAQFDEWRLSPAEQEVSFLLLKGLSIQEIADIRSTTARTVRQQASEVYQKSGLNGRAQLSAFFLEDLFDR